MIEVRLKPHSLGGYKSIEMLGHAQYADYGKDIVCAGISALIQTAVLGLENVVNIKPSVQKKQGYFLLKLPDNMTMEELEKAKIILDTTFLGIEDISKSYPLNIRLKVLEEV